MAHGGPNRAALTAFVGRSFLDADKALWYEVRDMLESFKDLGFEFEDAKASQPRPISEKVKEGIERNQIYIGILTRRRAVWDQSKFVTPTFGQRVGAVFKQPVPPQPSEWTSSEWVIEEIGYAIGRDRYVLLLIEEGVVFPVTDLDADTEFIPFNRAEVRQISSRLAEIIAKLISTRVKVIEAEASVPPPEDTKAEGQANNNKGKKTAFIEVVELVKEGRIAEADALQEKIVGEQGDPDEQAWANAILTRFRAKAGEAASLEWLRKNAELSPPNIDVITQLCELYRGWGQEGDAIAVLKRSAPLVKPKDRGRALYLLAQYLTAGKDFEGARQTLLEKLAQDPTPTTRANTFERIAAMCKEEGDDDLRLAALERAVQLEPVRTDLRFDLAYLYSAKERRKAAAFHYRVLAKDGEDTSAANNLALQYGELHQKHLENEAFEAIADELAIAKANLASNYQSAGLHKEAQRLATEAMQAEEALARDRATSVLNAIAEERRKGEELINNLDGDTRPERVFRAEYAEAAMRATPPLPSNPFEAVIEGRRFVLHAESNFLQGEVIEAEHLGLMIGNPSGKAPEGRRTRRFLAMLNGGAGSYTLENELIGSFGHALSSSKREGLLTVVGEFSHLTLMTITDGNVEVVQVPIVRMAPVTKA